MNVMLYVFDSGVMVPRFLEKIYASLVSDLVSYMLSVWFSYSFVSLCIFMIRCSTVLVT